MSDKPCPTCGYDLCEQFRRDSDVVVCPECGGSVRAQDCLIPITFSWKMPVLFAASPQILVVAFTMFGLRGDFAAFIPFAAFGAGVVGAIVAAVAGAYRTWTSVGARIRPGRRFGWAVAAMFENGVIAGITVFVLMFPTMVVAAIWRDATK